MRKLSLILLLIPFAIQAQQKVTSPHGDKLNISCDKCHSAKGWMLDREIYSFDHNSTKLPLSGQHLNISCRSCHKSLVFSSAPTECAGCHTDLHEQTAGPDCSRCHTTKSWVIENINEMHQRTRFPLIGPHYTADCSRCHKSASNLRFDVLGVSCYDCHQNDYNGTTAPNHVQSNFSKNCEECHSINNFSWNTAGIDHSFFPLTLGHTISDCNQCHKGNYTNLSKECVSCHQANYNATTNPDHTQASIPTTCADCHTTNPGWKPAQYSLHDAQFFPIYSGKHLGTWGSCNDCHTTGQYKTFSCIDCHAHPQATTDNEHQGVGGYVYASIPCYECHPTGSKEGSFNHNNSKFPLTGAHLTTPCSKCHTNGFAGTPTNCSDCHMPDYTSSTNPKHQTLSLPTTCATCHTTNPGWKPATFPVHDTYYQLTGAHATIAGNCAACHNGDYNNTPKECVGCHQTNYNQTTNPNHANIGIPNTCATCHTTNPGWKPATFPIHSNYYTLQGAHTSLSCAACHNGNYNNTLPTTCVGCHQSDYNNTTNPNHSAAQFPTDCTLCHNQTAWTPSTFNHDGQYFPIYSGKHQGTWSHCSDCHPNQTNYSVFTCTTACHPQAQMDNAHQGISGYQYLSSACYSCHPTGGGGGKMMRQEGIFNKSKDKK